MSTTDTGKKDQLGMWEGHRPELFPAAQPHKSLSYPLPLLSSLPTQTAQAAGRSVSYSESFQYFSCSSIEALGLFSLVLREEKSSLPVFQVHEADA